MAAVIGARLSKHVQRATNISKTVYWSDSQIVLCWLQSNKPVNRFVTNRVIEINQITGNQEWRYCPTSDNPADLLTRGISAQKFVENALWLHGPSWLYDEQKWPVWLRSEVSAPTTSAQSNVADLRPEVSVLTTSAQSDVADQYVTSADRTSPTSLRVNISAIIDIERFGSRMKLLRVSAYVLRFIANLRKQNADRTTTHLTVTELQQAEILWVKSCQTSVYREEIENLTSRDERRLPLVKQLRLYLDENQNICCGGRIHNAPLSPQTLFPCLLPQKHPFIRLVVLDAHERLLHSGTSATTTSTRQKYWIPAIRIYVQTILRMCVARGAATSLPYVS